MTMFGCITFFCLIVAFAAGQLDDLGLRINNQVHDSLNTIKNGIFAGENLGDRINHDVQESLNPLNDLGDRISHNVHDSLSPLDDLGARITAQVENSLQPVKAMEILQRMANGVGGVSVAYFDGKPRLFIEDNKLSICDGYIVDSPPLPRCVGERLPFETRADEDFCLSPFYSIINDHVCVSGKDSTVLFTMVSNRYKCSSADATTNTMMVTLDEYRRLCRGQEPWQRLYRYYANEADLMHVEIPNSNPYVKCIEQGKGVCLFENNVPKFQADGSTFQTSYSYHN